MSGAKEWCDAVAKAAGVESKFSDQLIEIADKHGDDKVISDWFVDPYDMSLEFKLENGCTPEEVSDELIKWAHDLGFVYVHFHGFPSARSR